MFSRLFALTLLLVFPTFCSYENPQTKSMYNYGKIPGCTCFLHCDCTGFYLCRQSDRNHLMHAWGEFPIHGTTCDVHPFDAPDEIWHDFMVQFLSAAQEGPFFSWWEKWIGDTVQANHGCCLLGDYLNATQDLRNKILSLREKHIADAQENFRDSCQKWGRRKVYEEELAEKIAKENRRTTTALKILDTIPAIITPNYSDLIRNCEHNTSGNMALTYNRGLLALMEGRTGEFLSSVSAFIDFARQRSNQKLLSSDLFRQQGEAFLEVGLYQEAIEALNTAIEKDPQNSEAYFQRAAAYFELGNVDQSLADYVQSKRSDHFSCTDPASSEFVLAFSASATQGAKEALCDFVPSLCSSLYGLGTCLWTFGTQPTESVQYLANVSYEMCDHIVGFLKTVDQSKLNKYASDLVALYQRYDQLSPKEKGELIGHAIGKHGTGFLAGLSFAKGVAVYKKLRDANRACTFEAMLASASNKKAIIAKAEQHHVDRNTFYANTRIHPGLQDKHIPGRNNYEIGNSIVEHPNPEQLLRRHAGTGTHISGKLGNGHKEFVDFGEHLGLYQSENGKICLPTTKGIIHYRKNGDAHIVPAHPNSKFGEKL